MTKHDQPAVEYSMWLPFQCSANDVVSDCFYIVMVRKMHIKLSKPSWVLVKDKNSIQ